MKKILICMLSFALLIVSVIPVSASDTELHAISGEWVLKDTLLLPEAGTVIHVETSGSNLQWAGYYPTAIIIGPEVIEMTYKKSGVSQRKIMYSDGQWKSSNVLKFPIDTEFAVSNEFYQWLLLNTIPNECDGTSCPANDVNHDNICDDCGMILTMSLRSTLLDFAHSVIDNALTIFDGAEYWLVTIGEPASKYNIYVSPSPFIYDKNTKALTSNGVVQRTTVTTHTDGSFKGGTSWAAKQPYTVLDNGKAIDSSHVIDNFFPIPLWMEMETLTQGEVVEVVAETNQTIMILVVCGVSLITLLSVLLLFGKRSLLFRN